ncbi:MAG: sugar ABC transporter permease, partial [Bacillati bacterium ANGP1]
MSTPSRTSCFATATSRPSKAWSARSRSSTTPSRWDSSRSAVWWWRRPTARNMKKPIHPSCRTCSARTPPTILWRRSRGRCKRSCWTSSASNRGHPGRTRQVGLGPAAGPDAPGSGTAAEGAQPACAGVPGPGVRHHHIELTDPDHQAFVGLGNFLALARDAAFWQSLTKTIFFTSISVTASFLFGLGFALLTGGLPQRFAAIRGLMLVPWVTPAVVVGFLFLYMFDQEVGVANLLLLHLHVIQHRLAWLSDANLAPAAVIVANVWSQTPFFVLMFTAGLTAIPAAQREAI